MSKLLLNLRNVPDDEADEVRALLDAHGIAHYETRPGPFGISAGGIFVAENADAAQARRLMAGYQQERSRRARAERAEAIRDGSAETFLALLRAQPGQVALRVLAILFVLALMALPVLLLLD